MHYKLGHHAMGSNFYRNHINFHHTYYSRDHLVSTRYLGDEGNNTPFFFYSRVSGRSLRLPGATDWSSHGSGDRVRGIVLYSRLL